MKLPRLNLVSWIACALFVFMTIGCYLRLFIGVGLLGYMDESYWVASSLLSSLGGRPYFNELYIQQTAALLYEPLVALYYKLFGNFALVLFVRHLYFLFAAFCAWIWFRQWRPRTDLITALAVAALALVGSFWAEPSLGYNAIGFLGFGTGVLLALPGSFFGSLEPERSPARNRRTALRLDRRVVPGGKTRTVLSAVFFALALGAYPTLLGGYILFLVLALVCGRLAGQSMLRRLLVNALITAGLLGAFVGSLVWREGFDNLILVYRFTTAQSSLGSFTDKISYGFFLWLAFLPPLWFWLPLYAVWLVLWLRKNVSWLVFAVPVCVYMLLKDPPEQGPIHPSLVLILALSGLPLVMAAARRNFAWNWAHAVIYTTALLCAALTCWSSALTVYATWVTATSCLAVVYVLARKSSPWLSLLTFVIPLTIFTDRIVLHQLDDRSLDVEMFTSGPNAGLFTSPERFKFLNQVQTDVDAAAAGASTILFYNEFPMGYLMSSLRPATRTMFLHGLRESGPQIQQFYREHYSVFANRPDVIFRFKYFEENGGRHSVDPAQYVGYEDVFWNYLPSEPEYFLLEDRDAYSVYKRRP